MATTTGIASLSNFTVPINGGGQDSGGMLMPKLKYRFRVIFTNFGTTTDVAKVTELTKQVVSAARPTVKFADQKIDVYNSTIHYAGKPNWDPISIKLRDDAHGAINGFVGEQNQKQFDFFEQSSAAAAGDYKFSMKIQMLDGGNTSNFSGADGSANILETWECFGCYLESSTFGALEYSDQGTGMTIDLSIRADNCVQTFGGGLAPVTGDRLQGTDALVSGAQTGA